MGGGDQELVEALHPLLERYGRERIEQAIKQIAPRKRGPKGPKYSDSELMQEAHYLYEMGHFCGDPDSIYKGKRTTHGALRRTVEKFCPVHRHNAVLRRLWTRFRRETLLQIVAAPEDVELEGRVPVQDDPDPPSRMWYHRSSFRPSLK